MLAVQLVLRIHDEFHTEVPLRAFYAAPTIGTVSRLLTARTL
jgi:acyl carrier protein